MISVAAPPIAHARSFEAGVFDFAFTKSDSSAREAWLDDAATAGSSTVKLAVFWRDIAPSTRPAAFDDRNPADPGYEWGNVDAAVRGASARGMDPVLTVSFAPDWAEAPGRPPGTRPGTWKPDPTRLGAFLHAAATRYSGNYPDPAALGQTLPRVRNWQVWNEPNLATYLGPQWTETNNGYEPHSPALYRALLNAAYDALKGVSRENVVVTAGTAPFGDLEPGGRRIAPAKFVREFTCVDGRMKARRCPERPRFDVLAHHPYSVGGPSRRALNEDDVTVPDMHKLDEILAVARRGGNLVPAEPKPLWVTELSWDSSPPDPQGVPEEKHAQWVAGAQRTLWRQGVERLYWFQIRDQAPTPSYAATHQSGLYLRDGTPKLAAQAFRFPLVLSRKRGGVEVWGRAPGQGKVTLERRAGKAWTEVAEMQTDSSGVFAKKLPVASKAVLRARLGGETSLAISAK